MSTPPTGWIAPKTNWTTTDPVENGDLNRMEGNAHATELGARTVDDSQVPASDTGTLRQLLDWIANRLLAISGKTNWYDMPAQSIETIINGNMTFAGVKTFGGGIAIETRTDDPATPVTGQIWLRTDL